MTTVASLQDARQIARKVLDARLAACVQMVAVDSAYLWKGELMEEAEILLLFKTRESLYDKLERHIIDGDDAERESVAVHP